MWGDEQVVRHMGGKPFTREEVWGRLLRYAGHWHLLGFGYWFVEEKATGNFVGEVGFAELMRDIEPSIKGTPEIGWVLARRAQGQGYATEAALAAIAWGEKHFGRIRTVCLINTENAPSLRVAEKCGYREFDRTIYKSDTHVLLSRGD
jgi:RimJ/RimL family protein N-acetyltransferase